MSQIGHEQNDEAGFELFSKVQPNWQNVKIWEAWGKYAQSQFTDIDGSVPKESLPSKQKEKIKIPLNNNEYPILVDEDLSSLATFSDLQAIIRSFLTTHYQISTGNAKASVPWTSLAECPGNYIDLPKGYKFWEPSCMTKEETRCLLDHWYNQKNNINAKVTFRFKSSLHPVANKGKESNPQQGTRGNEILSNDEHSANVRSQPGPSKPAARQQTVAFQELTTRPGPSKLMPNLVLAPSISGQQSVGVEEVDKDSPWHASITHKS
ncbi:hypothetical protein SERLADRAFT_434049 [Serpula lacrymans var. lacrymans S7.9]|uniref:Uncharacterized protein n=1 Tax=Serpula lacrymans var. lacrymans (strain S7.9) TaxID=578457 RepID=F8NLL1_SERL9|nr:uncharacterized protein SERLADRAFT_434049 [Serpula lacrymans var. lacrymans S7.9]EGO28192.1 hypothetical protein SERLADRAFT_434049 [Serpula lacrymans var. lacrymans S7.9]